MISILFNLLRLVLWSRISSILQKDLSLKKLKRLKLYEFFIIAVISLIESRVLKSQPLLLDLVC